MSTQAQERGRVGHALAARLDSITDVMLTRMWQNPALGAFARPEFRRLERDIARASLAREIECLRRAELPSECPPEDLAAARAAVAYGAPVTVVLQCFRAGHAALWGAWRELCDELVEDPRRRQELAEAGGEFMFAYVDRCAAWVEAEYAREHRRVEGSVDERLLRDVRRVLSAAEAPASVAGYPLAPTHLALVAWGDDRAAALREVSRRFGAEALIVPADPNSAWAWIVLSAAHVREARARLAKVELPLGARLAVGGPATGHEGFAAAHREARAARRVAGERLVTWYSDVALEDLVLRDESAARAFVIRELAGLPSDERLRDTLTAYFRCGQNAASTASVLGVHERTIANRLRTIEKTLGTTVAARRAELETALRIERALRGVA